METIKEVADSLFSKEGISQEQYDIIKESGMFEMTKEAIRSPTKFVRFAKTLGNYAKLVKPVGLAAAIGGAAALVGKELVVDPIVEAGKIKKSFKMMSAKTPQLAEKDQDQIKDYFNVIKTFSPKAASNPLVAGALVNKMMEFGGVDHKLVQDIAAIESGIMRPSAVQTATDAAAKSVATFPKGA